jgi:predicted dithiol-disulfide oxidoreductase (DUF899 family)
MDYAQAHQELEVRRRRIEALRTEMREVQAAVEPQPVEDYVFQTADGQVRLSELFGANTDLFVIHNMGAGCSACTMWADGFNGVYDHLADRAAFVVSSPDAPAKQQAFAKGRDWRFPMVSHQGSDFAADMGYRGDGGGWEPGVSVFKRTAAGIVRVSDAELGPGDDFCVAWHLFDMLPEGAAGWHPKYAYAV